MKTNPTKSSTKSRADDPMLVSLWRADAVLRIAGQVDGPKGYRSALGDSRSRGELPEQVVRSALDHVWAVQLTPFDDARRILSLAMQTRNGEPRYNIREIASIVGLSKSQAHRRLKLGLFFCWCLLTPLSEARERQRSFADVHKRAA